MIWFNKSLTLEHINETTQGNSLEHLSLEFTELGDDFLCGQMPVDHRTTQPFKLFHGGLNCFLAESLASTASNLCINNKEEFAVGISINTNHMRPAVNGKVTGKATPVHIGKQTHVWSVETFDENGKLTSQTTMTNFVKKRN